MDEINFEIEYKVFIGSNLLIAVLSLAMFIAALNNSLFVVDIISGTTESGKCAIYFYYQFIRGNDEEPY